VWEKKKKELSFRKARTASGRKGSEIDAGGGKTKGWNVTRKEGKKPMGVESKS